MSIFIVNLLRNSVKDHTLTSVCALQSPVVYLTNGKHSATVQGGGKCLVVTTELFLKLWSNKESSFYDTNN